MSRVYVKNVRKKVSVMHEVNPFPDMGNNLRRFRADEEVNKRLNVNYGNVANVFPYKEQDLYSCELKTKNVKTIVLENEYIKAVFLPEFGARLMSIYDKKRKKDIVYNNDAVRITNVALRNAWFAGGVEWNSGLRGHSPFTCDNVFCEIMDKSDSPAVRFYEWERIRKQFFEITAYLPDKSRQLFIKVRLFNCNSEETPAYWWSNIAVREDYSTRVITNCEKTYGNDYGGVITRLDVPYRGKTEITYPVRNPNAVDYFFDTFDDKQRFIMTVDDSGDAFFQTSTRFLAGRKEFVWGMAQGSFNWQKKLCGSGGMYFEVQAGLARTQMECVPMPGDAVWEWTECYGMTTVDKEKIYSTDWDVAREEGALRVCEAVDEEKLQRISSEIDKILENKGELVHEGSAWASLEKKINFKEVYRNFAETAPGDEQKPWLELLQNKSFAEPDDINDNPAGYIYDKKLMEYLEKYASENWYGQFHAGLMYYAEGNIKKAYEVFQKSVSLKENPWGYYAMAECDAADGNFDVALQNIFNVMRLRPNDIRVLRKLFRYAFDGGKSEKYIDVYEKLPLRLRNDSRLKLLAAISYVEVGNIERFEEILSHPFELYDIREGEKNFAEAWEKYMNMKYFTGNMTSEEKRIINTKHPIPHWLDYGTSII